MQQSLFREEPANNNDKLRKSLDHVAAHNLIKLHYVLKEERFLQVNMKQ